MKHTILSLSIAAALSCTAAHGQLTKISEIPLTKSIVRFDNSTFRMAYLGADDSLYALKQVPVVETPRATNLAFNPAGSYIAVTYEKLPVSFWSFLDKNRRIAVIRPADKEKSKQTALCFSPDARHFLIADDKNRIQIYATKDLNAKNKEPLPTATIATPAPATRMAVSPNSYFIATVNGPELTIWNFETTKAIRTLNHQCDITGLAFSPDGTMLAVTTTDGTLEIYDTKTWNSKDRYTDMENIESPAFNFDGKYLALVRNTTTIEILNLKAHTTTQTLECPQAVKTTRFCYSADNSVSYLINAMDNSLIFYNANGLDPLYGKILESQVSSMMSDWSKMAEGESMDDYKIRMSDENRSRQFQLFSQEAATTLAGDRLAMSKMQISDYDAATGLLGMSFSGLGTIDLAVPAAEVAQLGQGTLKFKNAVYTLADDDQFKLSYVEVVNETTGKTYIYDNIGRTKMTAMNADMDFVPLEVLQQATQEEVQLQSIKEEVVAQKKLDKLITDQTQINVTTEVIPDVNADGQKILNYKIGYQYQVDREFSAREDFPSGGYNIESSPAAMSMIKIISQAFEGDFAKYLSDGQKVRIIITGSADASPIRGRISYDGRYGEFQDEPYYMNGNLDNLTVTRAGGIIDNPQLAFIRAAGVREMIFRQLPTLSATRNEVQTNVEVAKEVGGEHRRIKVEFVIIDAFRNN